MARVPAVSTRHRLSEHAARLFAERGYHGTSIGDLAAALGIQKASIYSHIKGKEDLLAELALAGATAFHEALDDVPADAPAGERLRLALRAHLDVVDRQLDVATVWLQEWRYLSGPARETFLAERRRYERRVSDLFEAAVEAGDLRADLDVRHATLAFLSLGNWAYTWMTHQTDVGQVADAFWSLLLTGAGPR
ncbi:MAG: TetR/AcrR family transcriptional regulator, cholesterol catabolism regulator [bacterium]